MIPSLRELGFTDYEARVYAALAQNSPISAYEAAKEAGVPTSKVYEVLARLEERGVVMEAREGDKKLYVPLEPTDLAQRERSKMGRVLDTLVQEWKAHRRPASLSWLWNLRSLEELQMRARQLIEGAKRTLLISVWDEELEWVNELLAGLANRGIQTATVVFGEGNGVGLGQVYRHPIRDTLYQERGGRGLVLVADGGEVLWATFGSDAVEGVWSRSAGFVTLAEDYVKHDIYIMKLVSRYGADMLKRFGPGYRALRDVFQDEEES